MNLEQQICARVIDNCSGVLQELLKSCQLKIVVISENSALLIQCPNSWTAERLRGLIIGKVGQTLHSLGIDRAVLDDSESMKAYYQWEMTNFIFKGYFVDGDLNNLAFVPIPKNLRGVQAPEFDSGDSPSP